MHVHIWTTYEIHVEESVYNHVGLYMYMQVKYMYYARQTNSISGYMYMHMYSTCTMLDRQIALVDTCTCTL